MVKIKVYQKKAKPSKALGGIIDMKKRTVSPTAGFGFYRGYGGKWGRLKWSKATKKHRYIDLNRG